MEQEIATQVVGLGGNSDFTLWSLFLRADFVVKSVIIILLVSSVYSWALIFDKFKLFKKINIQPLMILKINFGKLSQLKVLIIIYQLNRKIQ